MLFRSVLSPVLFAMIVASGHSWPAFVLWTGLALTDGLDGWLARRMGTTRSGAFLDPLADKVLVIGAMISLVAIGVFWWLPVVLITAREVLLSLYRSYWGRRGLAIPATYWAKVKTLAQGVAVGFALLPVTTDAHPWVATGFLWLAVVLTLATGAHYVLQGRRAMTVDGHLA